MNASNQTSNTIQNKLGVCKSEEPIGETIMVEFQGCIVGEIMFSSSIKTGRLE